MTNECEYCGTAHAAESLVWTSAMDLACLDCYDLLDGISKYHQVFNVLYIVEKLNPYGESVD